MPAVALAQAIEAVFVAGLVLGLGDAVGVDEETRARLEAGLATLVGGFGQERDRKTTGGEVLDGAVRVHQQRRVVAGVGVGQAAGRGLEHRAERGRVLLGRRALVEPSAELVADLVGGRATLDRRR